MTRMLQPRKRHFQSDPLMYSKNQLKWYFVHKGTVMLHLYGIPNCQTVKKARVWLEENGIEYVFHNFKTEAPTTELLQSWLQTTSLESLVNKRGTTWRKLSEDEQAALQNPETAMAVLIANSSVIKRPVAVIPETPLILGFDIDTYTNAFVKS